MNNKGFTLIEVLAVVVILAMVFVFSTRSVLNAIENSKKESEKIFVDKINSLISDYLDYISLDDTNGLVMATGDKKTSITFDKCYSYKNGECDNKTTGIEADLMVKSDGIYVSLQDLVDKKLISESDLVNPRTKERCKNISKSYIYIFKDSDYVYYYFTDLNTSCGVSTEDKTNIISTFPESFCTTTNESTLKNLIGEDNFNKICTNVKDDSSTETTEASADE